MRSFLDLLSPTCMPTAGYAQNMAQIQFTEAEVHQLLKVYKLAKRSMGELVGTDTELLNEPEFWEYGRRQKWQEIQSKRAEDEQRRIDEERQRAQFGRPPAPPPPPPLQTSSSSGDQERSAWTNYQAPHQRAPSPPLAITEGLSGTERVQDFRYKPKDDGYKVCIECGRKVPNLGKVRMMPEAEFLCIYCQDAECATCGATQKGKEGGLSLDNLDWHCRRCKTKLRPPENSNVFQSVSWSQTYESDFEVEAQPAQQASNWTPEEIEVCRRVKMQINCPNCDVEPPNLMCFAHQRLAMALVIEEEQP